MKDIGESETEGGIHGKIEFCITLSPVLHKCNVWSGLVSRARINRHERKDCEQTVEDIENHPQHKGIRGLELHIMRTLTLAESESLVKVLLQHGDLLDALHQLSIDSLLVGLALLRDHRLE